VAAIDRDPASVDRAQSQDASSDIEYLLGEFLTYPFQPASFDLIVSIAALHHMDATAGLDRMRHSCGPEEHSWSWGSRVAGFPTTCPSKSLPSSEMRLTG
jgi:hypothetical protein